MEIFENEEVSQGEFFLQIAVDTEGIVEFYEVGGFESIDNFVDVFFVKDALIKLAFKLFKLSLDKGDWLIKIKSSVKNFVIA